MIPRHLSLVPVNPFQLAALQAIIEVEECRQRGKYPYAVALLRQLRGGKAGKAQARLRNLRRRILKSAPLFADELIARELALRPEYFKGR